MHAPCRLGAAIGRTRNDRRINGVLTQAEWDAAVERGPIKLNEDFRAKNQSFFAGTGSAGGGIHAAGKSAYRGVSWHKNKSKWTASIKVSRCSQATQVHLGQAADEEGAARLYDTAKAHLKRWEGGATPAHRPS
jgi:hypothetical protein